MRRWSGTELPKMNAKGVLCDSYSDRVRVANVPFATRSAKSKQGCTLRRFMRRGFPYETSITYKR